MLRTPLILCALAWVCATTPASAISVDVIGSYGPITEADGLTVFGTWTLQGGETSFTGGFFAIGGQIVSANVIGGFNPTDPFGFLSGTFAPGSLTGITGTVPINMGGISNLGNAGTDFGGTSLQINPVPEPSTFVLAGVGMLAVAWRRRRQLGEAPPDEDGLAA